MSAPRRPLLAALLALAACKPDLTTRCRAQVRAREFEQAATTCARAWEQTHAPKVGAAAATAHSQRNQPDAVRTWLTRLTGTAGEPEALVALARVELGANRDGPAAQALTRAVSVGTRLGDHVQVTLASFGLASLAVRQQRYLEALRALDDAEQGRTRAGMGELRQAILGLLFDVLYDVGDIEAARRVLSDAVALTGPDDVGSLRYLRAKQALVHEADGNWALQRQALEETLALDARARDPHPVIAWSTTLNLIVLATERGDLAGARRYLATAERLAGANPSLPVRSQVALLRRRAMVARAGGALDEARTLVARAQALGPSDEAAWELATDEGELAEAAGQLGEARRAYQRAIEVVDRSNAALGGLGDLQLWSVARKRRPFARLFALHARHGEVAPAFALWDRLARQGFVQGLIRGAGQPAADEAGGPPIAQGRARLQYLEQILPTLNASPRTAPAAPAGSAPPPWLSGLFYFQGEDDLYVLVVDRGAVTIHRAGRSPAALATLVARFVARPDDQAVAAELGALLVPTLPGLADPPILHLAPARALAEVPFAALRVRGRRLIDQAALAFIPSLGVVERAPVPTGASAVVLADPLGDLPQARAEGMETAARLGAVALIGEAATRARLTSGARGPALLHLATHSGLGRGGPWLQLRDGRLLARDLLDLGLHVGTVVIPTCSSAVGAAPGVLPSLALSFLAGGALRVLGALRSVEDGTARRFVHDFYDAGGAREPVLALARTQRRWARTRSAADWSPFVILGSGAPPGPQRASDSIRPGGTGE